MKMWPEKIIFLSFRGHICLNLAYTECMKQYLRIAIVIAVEHVETFLDNLDEDTACLLVIADEIRESATGKAWLYKYQKWGEADEFIRRLLGAMRKLPENAYFYATKISARTKTICQGSSALKEIAIPIGQPRTGIFFEDFNF